MRDEEEIEHNIIIKELLIKAYNDDLKICDTLDSKRVMKIYENIAKHKADLNILKWVMEQ